MKDADSYGHMTLLPSGMFDHTITDPPYNERSKNARSVYDGRASNSSLGRSALGVKGSGIAWSMDAERIDYLVRQLLRVTKQWVIVFCALEHLGLYEAAAKKAWVRAGVWSPDDGDEAPFFSGLWDRNNTGTPQLTGDRPAQGAEGIAIMHNPAYKKEWNGKGSRGIWRYSVDRMRGRHPAAKPLPLGRELLRLFTNRGDLVFDPFCGAGNLGICAVESARRYYGIDNGERDTDSARWADLARLRICRYRSFSLAR